MVHMALTVAPFCRPLVVTCTTFAGKTVLELHFPSVLIEMRCQDRNRRIQCTVVLLPESRSDCKGMVYSCAAGSLHARRIRLHDHDGIGNFLMSAYHC
jgi:hypothetical protein